MACSAVVPVDPRALVGVRVGVGARVRERVRARVRARADGLGPPAPTRRQGLGVRGPQPSGAPPKCGTPRCLRRTARRAWWLAQHRRAPLGRGGSQTSQAVSGTGCVCGASTKRLGPMLPPPPSSFRPEACVPLDLRNRVAVPPPPHAGLDSVTGGDVYVAVLDSESGVATRVRCPSASLVLHSHLFNVPITSLRDLLALAASAEHVVAIHSCRRAVVGVLLLLLEEDGTDGLVAVPELLRLVKLVAASEDAFGAGRVGTGAGLVPCAEGGRLLPPTVPVMAGLQVCICVHAGVHECWRLSLLSMHFFILQLDTGTPPFSTVPVCVFCLPGPWAVRAPPPSAARGWGHSHLPVWYAGG